MKIKEAGILVSERLQVFCNIVVTDSIGSCCPKAGLWSAFGTLNWLLEHDKHDLLNKADVIGVTNYETHKCVELLIKVDEEFD